MKKMLAKFAVRRLKDVTEYSISVATRDVARCDERIEYWTQRRDLSSDYALWAVETAEVYGDFLYETEMADATHNEAYAKAALRMAENLPAASPVRNRVRGFRRLRAA